MKSVFAVAVPAALLCFASTSVARGQDKSAQINKQEIQKVFGQDAQVIDLASLQQEQLQALQSKLRQLGHYSGNVDGVAGEKTNKAVMAFIDQRHQVSRQLAEQGRLTKDALTALGLNESEIQPVRGEEAVQPGQGENEQEMGLPGTDSQGEAPGVGPEETGTGAEESSTYPENE